MAVFGRFSRKHALAGAVMLSLAFTLARGAWLNGSAAALVITVVAQFYLSGYLLARALGKHTIPQPVARFTWILLCAFGLNVSLSAAARLFHVPVPVYLLLLHGVMLALALVRPLPARDETSWRWSWRSLPLVLLVALCCVVVFGVGLERSRFRFNGYEDQTVFVELADWLANDPDDPGIRSRRVGVLGGDSRWDTDGWTYVHAAWVWTSGVPAWQLIWFDLTPLFVWVVPLAIFGLAYEATRREEAAALCAAAATVFGLMTLDALVYVPTWMAFGQFSLVQVNTLRTMATALMTPLALIAALAYLRAPSPRYLPLVFLAGLALATMHPRQITIVLYSIGATAGLWWLVQPSRRRLWQAAALLLVLASVMLLPLAQRLARPGLGSAIDERVEQALEAGDPEPADDGGSAPAPLVLTSGARGSLLALNLPVLGATLIVDPPTVFYHPVIIAVAVLGLMAALGARRSLAAQYLFGTTAATLILLFVPGVSGVFIRIVSPTIAPSIGAGLPVALALGLAADWLLRLASRIRLIEAAQRWVVAGIAAFAILALLFEPFPIAASARDQIRASNISQAVRDMHPSEAALVQSLRALLPPDRRSVVLAPNRSANYISESLPHTLITGGRHSSNLAYTGTRRFLTDGADPQPWLDAEDLAYLTRWGVTHIVLEADDTRAPQLFMQPERFEYLASAAGFVIFRVAGDLTPAAADDLFARMNGLFRDQLAPRWDDDGFYLTLPGAAAGWSEIAGAWEAMPEDDNTRLGLAFAYLMMGEDARALPLWEALHAAYPDLSLLTDALAYSRDALGAPEQGAQALVAALDSPQAATRVLAARTLLTEQFFYLLDAAQLERAIRITGDDFVTWDELANFNQSDSIRARAALLLGRGMWETAANWYERLPEVERDPRDFLTLASLALVQGDVSRALAVLQPAADPDFIRPNAHWHPDRWTDNVAAQGYFLLAGALARREGRPADAEAAFRQAVNWGAAWAGRYFLAQTLAEAGDSQAADSLMTQLAAEWQANSGAPLPELVPLLAIADERALYAMLPQAQLDDETRTLTVTATYGSPPIAPYPARAWRVQVISPDASAFYAETEVPATFVSGALVRVPVTLQLPEDIPPLTPALVVIEPRYDNRVTFGQTIFPVTLNRPGDALPGANATPVDARFGDAVTLESYEADASESGVALTLYWRADTPLAEDYQVFVHVVNADGAIVAQRDGAPAGGRYPTSRWRANTLIADAHSLAFQTPLPPGEYRIVVGLYRLPEAMRLAVSPQDERVQDDALTLETFAVAPGA